MRFIDFFQLITESVYFENVNILQPVRQIAFVTLRQSFLAGTIQLREWAGVVEPVVVRVVLC